MGRRKKDNSIEIVKGVLALLLLLGLASGTGGGRMGGFLSSFVVLCLTLAIVVFAVGCLFLLARGLWRWTPRHLSLPTFASYRSTGSSFTESPAPPALTVFSEDLLRELEWRRFEILVQGYFTYMGFSAERIGAGADGGIDLVLRQKDSEVPHSLVQCKAWNTYPVDVKPIRELFGVMAAEQAPHGYFITSGRYTREALAWAESKPMTLVDGREFLEWLNGLNDMNHEELLLKITEGDYQTPSCPKCDIKLVKRQSRFGEFWGCPNFGSRTIKCRYKMPVKSSR